MKLRPQSKAGGLRHRVKFQKKTDGTDAWGGPTVTWSDHVTVWAEVIYMGGNEFWAARQANSEAQGRVRIRYRSDLNPTMRIIYDGKTLEILSMMPYDSRKTEMHILFKEVL
jgi:SPP1 family predicted phage head-tail adaptor